MDWPIALVETQCLNWPGSNDGSSWRGKFRSLVHANEKQVTFPRRFSTLAVQIACMR